MKTLKHLLTVTLCLFISSLAYSAQPPKILKLIGIKGIVAEVPFTNQTTIAQLKEAIQTQEGVPTDQQKLFRSEKGSFLGLSFDSGVSTELESLRTCSDYDLKADEEIRLILKRVKSPAEIEAALKARTEKIAEVLTQDVLLKELLPKIFAYDTCPE